MQRSPRWTFNALVPEDDATPLGARSYVMESGKKLLTLAQAAELSACSSKTVRRAIDAGKLSACRLGQGAKSDRIHPADLDAWWTNSRLAAVPAPKLPFMPPPPLSMDTEDEVMARILARCRAKAKPSARRKAKGPKIA